jgi:hypothetical protein
MRLPGRPVELHHQPPTEPYVNLSIYTARASYILLSSGSGSLSGPDRANFCRLMFDNVRNISEGRG